ncbi:MAG: nuclear transport factor 2 family protein [Pseudomonadota bacterium]
MTVLERWHAALEAKDASHLDGLLAENCVMHSPVVHTPQEGKAITTLYLTAAMHVLGNDSFHYVREISEGRDAMLEFVTEVEGITINGVDIISWNEDDQIVSFKVMVRPLKAINMVHAQMKAMLESFAAGADSAA